MKKTFAIFLIMILATSIMSGCSLLDSFNNAKIYDTTTYNLLRIEFPTPYFASEPVVYGGNVTINGLLMPQDGYINLDVQEDDEFVLVATAFEGYTFRCWSMGVSDAGGILSEESNYTYTYKQGFISIFAEFSESEV